MRIKDPKPNLERLKTFFSEVNDTHVCEKCSICTNTFQKPVVDIRNALLSEVDVLFISEAASKEDVEYRVPFVGPSGLFFRQALYDAEVDKCSVVFTNSVVCRPIEESKLNRIPSLKELENCSERIKVFIETLRPKRICLVGAVARDFYSKKLKEWGMLNIPVFLIHHPVYIMRLGGRSSVAYSTWVESIQEVLFEKE